MNTIFCVAAFLIASQPPVDYSDRERHPLAPSLPLLTKEESRKIDAVIDRFIEFDIGKLKGTAGKQALNEFNRLGPESIFNLIDGLNRAANMESSCPAVIIGKKVGAILISSNDMELLKFAQQNIGADVTAKRHLAVLQDLQSSILFRKGALQRRALASGGAKSPSALSLAELESAMSKERGLRLKTLLTEAEKRQGAKAVDLLIKGMASPERDVAKFSEGLLVKNLQHQNTEVLRTMLKHDRRDVRIAAAQAIGAKKLRFGSELIVLLQDSDDDVREAGRRALVQIAGGADYGTDVERWTAWWSKQK